MPWQHRYSRGSTAPALDGDSRELSGGDTSSAQASSRDASGHDGSAAGRQLRVPLERLTRIRTEPSSGRGTQSAR